MQSQLWWWFFSPEWTDEVRTRLQWRREWVCIQPALSIDGHRAGHTEEDQEWKVTAAIHKGISTKQWLNLPPTQYLFIIWMCTEEEGHIKEKRGVRWCSHVLLPNEGVCVCVCVLCECVPHVHACVHDTWIIAILRLQFLYHNLPLYSPASHLIMLNHPMILLMTQTEPETRRYS